MSTRAILFDLDGTLLDSVSVILKSNREVCAAMGIPYDEAMWRSWIGMPLEAQARKLTQTRHTEYMENYKQVYRHYQDQDLRLFPGTLSMLDELRSRGYITAVVTSKATRGTLRVLEAAGLDSKFDAVITCDDVENPKPHPDPILKALEALDVGPEEALYVGDSLFDLDSARGAGVRMVGVSWGARTREELLSAGVENVFDAWEGFLDWLRESESPGPL